MKPVHKASVFAMWSGLLLVIWCTTVYSIPSSIPLPHDSLTVRECEPITTDLCRDVGYNVTGMPNALDHDTQYDAEIQLRTFTSLIQYNCDPALNFFLCATYVPMCSEKVSELIGPCRSLCQRVRNACLPVLNTFGFAWPPMLECENFPPRNDRQHMCMDGGVTVDDNDNSHDKTTGPPRPATPRPANCGHLRKSDQYLYVNRTESCWLLCSGDALFTSADKRLANVWLTVWATLCFVSTTFAVLTFLIDASRYVYPQRAAVAIAFCYISCSIAYFVRLVAGYDVISCVTSHGSTMSSDSHAQSGSAVRTFVQEGLDNTDCTVVFLLLYYFSMAAALWWVVMCLAWLLIVSLRWSADVVARRSSLFHLVAWAVPAIQTVVVLVLRAVDADELTGMCFVGNTNQRHLIGFVVAPLSVYLALGSAFLVAGFVCLLRCTSHGAVPQNEDSDGCQPTTTAVPLWRTGVQPCVTPSDTPSYPTWRTCVLCLLYGVMLTCVVLCHVYESVKLPAWQQSVLVTGDSDDKPSVHVALLRIAATLVVGVAIGVLICERGTMHAWRCFLRRVCRCLRSRDHDENFGGKLISGSDAERVTSSTKYRQRSRLQTVSQQHVDLPRKTGSDDVFPPRTLYNHAPYRNTTKM